MIQEWLQTMARYDPAFSKGLEPADSEEIERLERLTRHELPVSYAAYLSAMGRRDGGLGLAFNGTMDIRRLISHYENIEEGKQAAPAPGMLIIGLGDPQVGEVLLDLTAPDPPVLFGRHGKPYQRYADTLRQLLYRAAFIRYELARAAHVAIYTDRVVRNVMSMLAAAAGDLRFQKLPFSDSIAYCARNPSQALILESFPGTLAVLKIGGSNRIEIEETGQHLASRLGLNFKQWWQPSSR